MYFWTIPSCTMGWFSLFNPCESFSAAPCFIPLRKQERKVGKIFY